MNIDPNIFEYWGIIKARKKFIVYFIGLATLTAIVTSLLLPKYYKAEAVVMPVARPSNAGLVSTFASQLSGLANLMGGSSGQTQGQQLVALLNSRTLAEKIVNKYGLERVFLGDKVDPDKERSMERAVSELTTYVSISNDLKAGTISITAEFKDPKLAASIANGYVEGLQDFINTNSFTAAKRNRFFIEEQLRRNKEKLLNSGKELSEFYKSGKVSSIESKIDVPIDPEGLVSIDHADANHVGTELEALRQKETDVESKLVVVKNVPQQVYLQYLTLHRGLLNEINMLLTQQYEMAKIEEARDELSFQVIDSAKPPLKKYKPQRQKIVTTVFILSLFLAVTLVFVEKSAKNLIISSPSLKK